MGSDCVKAELTKENSAHLRRVPISSEYKRNVCLQNNLFLYYGKWNHGFSNYHKLYFRYNTPSQFLPKHYK